MSSLPGWKTVRKCGLLVAALVWGVSGAGWSQTSLPDGEGKEVVETVCTQCHGLFKITDSRFSQSEWQTVVMDMVSNGAPLTDAEVETAVQYLAQNFGEKKASEGASQGASPEGSQTTAPEKVNLNAATAKQLEDSLGLSDTEAQGVVGYREKNGKFVQWEDLKKVSGLDIKKIEAKKDRLAF